MLVDITSDIFYKCTATFRTHFRINNEELQTKFRNSISIGRQNSAVRSKQATITTVLEDLKILHSNKEGYWSGQVSVNVTSVYMQNLSGTS